MSDKLLNMKDAVKKFVSNGKFIFFGGFGGHETFSVGCEIIRQGFKNIKGTKAAGGILFDMMIGAGCIDEICINDILITFRNHGYEVAKTD